MIGKNAGKRSPHRKFLTLSIRAPRTPIKGIADDGAPLTILRSEIPPVPPSGRYLAHADLLHNAARGMVGRKTIRDDTLDSPRLESKFDQAPHGFRCISAVPKLFVQIPANVRLFSAPTCFNIGTQAHRLVFCSDFYSETESVTGLADSTCSLCTNELANVIFAPTMTE